jgi:hypothetical protein
MQLAYNPIFSNNIPQMIPAGLHNIFSFAGGYALPFAVTAMLQSIDLHAPAFVMG